MGWVPYPTALNGYGTAGQDAASTFLNNSAIPQSIRDQMAGAQAMQAAATSTAPHTSMLATGLQGLAGFLGGRQEAQANAAAAPYQNPAGQPDQSSILARLLRGGPPTGSDDGAPPAAGWAGVGQGAGQAAQAIGRKSDRRLKSDVVRIGALPNGLAVYRYRLEGSPSFEVGCMADEVALVRPDATWFDPDDGFARVDYSRIS